jgi:hypothetical protein
MQRSSRWRNSRGSNFWKRYRRIVVQRVAASFLASLLTRKLTPIIGSISTSKRASATHRHLETKTRAKFIENST